MKKKLRIFVDTTRDDDHFDYLYIETGYNKPWDRKNNLAGRRIDKKTKMGVNNKNTYLLHKLPKFLL